MYAKISQNSTGETQCFLMSAFCMLQNGEKRCDKFASKYLRDKALQGHYISTLGVYVCVCVRGGKKE